MTVKPDLAPSSWQTRRRSAWSWARLGVPPARRSAIRSRCATAPASCGSGRIVAQDVRIVGDAGAYPLALRARAVPRPASCVRPLPRDDARIERRRVHEHRPASAIPRLRRDAGGVRLRVPDRSDRGDARARPGPRCGSGDSAPGRPPPHGRGDGHGRGRAEMHARRAGGAPAGGTHRAVQQYVI